MRRPILALSVILAVAATTAGHPGVLAQSGSDHQLPLPPGGFKPPPMPPVKPYAAVPVKAPAANGDQGFAAFRKQLGEAAARKDRPGLEKLLVPRGFFWMQDRDLADKRKSSLANLAAAIDLDAKDGSGWEILAVYANEGTAEPLPDRPSIICGPAEPSVDPKAFTALIKQTQSEPPEWGYPSRDGVEMREAPKPDAAVVERLGVVLIRVLPDTAAPEGGGPPPFLHVAAPSGKTGYVAAEALANLGGDQMCYAKDASGGWKITGYIGGVSQ